MPRYSLQMVDHNGNYQPVLTFPNGAATTYVPIPGEAIGVHNVSFNPEGSVIDKIGTLSCTAELLDPRNLALRAGTSLRLRDNDTGLIAARTASITARNVTVGANGHSAAITAPDLLDELRRSTCSYATAANEPLNGNGGTLDRLAKIRTETAWIYETDITDGSLDGIDFSAPGVSVAQAFAKLATERLAHFRRDGANGGRTIFFARFGTSSGLALSGAAEDPTRAKGANLAIRQILDNGLEIDEAGSIVNMLIPTGGGNGIAQLTLGPLYNFTGEVSLGNGVFQSGPLAFNGYDPTKPIRRRPAENGGQNAVDGNEYFIEDDTSVAYYGVWEDYWQQSQIAPILNGGAVDLANAAGALYQATVAHLRANSQPHTQYKVTTEGGGDLRYLGGQTIRLIYRGLARRRVYATVTEFVPVDLNVSLTILEIMVSEADDESLTAVWTLSDNGQYAASDTSIVIASLDQVSYSHFTAQTAVALPNLPFDGVLDNSAPMTRNFPGNGGTVQIVQAKITVYVIPAWSSLQPKVHGHDVATDMMNHDVNAIPHDVAALPSVEYRIGGNPLENGAVDYDPATHFHISANPPGSAVAVLYDPVGQFFYYSGSSHGTQDVPLASSHLGIVQVNPTSGGTGGKVVQTTGASTGSGQVGGVVPPATHTYTESGATKKGALSSVRGVPNAAVGAEWGRYENPAPLPNVTVMIGSTVVGTTAGGVGNFDATFAVNANGAGRVDFPISFTAPAVAGNPTGLCYVYGLANLRLIVSSLNAPI